MQRIILGNGKVSKIIRNSEDIIVSHEDLDIRDRDSVVNLIKSVKCEVVINTVAKTNLEWCQENKEECYQVNTAGVLNVLESCASTKKKLVHISSGCLFDGNEVEVNEESIESPAVWYTHTKTWADQIIKNFGYENYLILRPRQLVSAVAHPTNLLTKFSNMKEIRAIDEPNSTTCIEDFGLMIDHLIRQDQTGIFNCANSGVISPYKIAKMIQKTINQDLSVEKIAYEDFLKTLTNKRVNTILSTKKLDDTGFKNRSAEDAVEWCLKNYR